MFNKLSTHTQHRLQYSLVISGLTAGAAALITFILIAVVFLMTGMNYYGHPMAMYMPHLHLLPSMMPSGVLDEAAWLFLLAMYAGLLVGIPAFVLVYLGRAETN